MKAKAGFPFMVSATVMLAMLVFSLLFVFTDCFARFGEGFALTIYFDAPFVWLAIAAYNLLWRRLATHSLPQNGRLPIPLWSILLCAAVPVIVICGWMLSALAAAIHIQSLTGAMFDLTLRRILTVAQIILCLPYFAMLISGYVRPDAVPRQISGCQRGIT